MIVMLVLPPVLAVMWFMLMFEEVREFALVVIFWLLFLGFLALLMYRRWKNRLESSREYMEGIQEKKEPVVIESYEPPDYPTQARIPYKGQSGLNR